MSVSACRRNHSGMWRIWNTVERFPASLEKKSIRHTVEHGNPIHLGSTFLETLPRNLHIDPYNLQSIYSIYKNEKYTSFILQIHISINITFCAVIMYLLMYVCLFLIRHPKLLLCDPSYSWEFHCLHTIILTTPLLYDLSLSSTESKEKPGCTQFNNAGTDENSYHYTFTKTLTYPSYVPFMSKFSFGFFLRIFVIAVITSRR